MITADPQQRVSTLHAIIAILDRNAPPEDRELLRAFAPVVYERMPDSLALKLSAEALAERISRNFRFVARTMPPAFQLYKGLPGLHVSVSNPDDDEGVATGATSEVTIVETHTPDAPFIFESLKNYFQKEGLRVFSAIYPVFTVRRQWERVVWIGGAQQDGSHELLCQFHIERVDARERVRRIEHQVFSVLKTVFLGVEDYPAMIRGVSEVGSRLRARREDAAAPDPARTFLDWLKADNFVMLGLLRYQFGADGQPHADQTSALGVFKDPALLPVVFPGLMEAEAAQLRPAAGDDRIIDIDYCPRAQAIHHVEPIDDVVIREWRPDGSISAATLLIGRLAKGALTAKPQDIPLVKEKLASVLAQCGEASNSHAYRETRALFNHFPRRELLYADVASLKTTIDRMIYMASDNEVVVTRRQGTGYVAVAIAFSDLHYSHKAEEDLRRALAEAFGPISFNTWADLGVIALLLFYFDEASLDHPIDVEKARQITSTVISTWEDRVGATLEQAFGALEGRRLFKRYVRTETRSGLYRESTRPEEVPEDLKRFEMLEAELETSVRADSSENATLKIYSPGPLGLTETLRTLEQLALPVCEEMAIPIVLPEGRRIYLQRLRIEAAPEVIAALVDGEDRLRAALRALQEGRATDDPLNKLLIREGMSWRDIEVLRTLRNHLLQIRPVLNTDTANGVLLRNSKASAALYRAFAARFDPAQDDREAAIKATDEALRKAMRAVASLFDDEILRGLENLVRSTVRTNAYQRPERPVFSIKVDSARVEGMVSPRPLFEIYVHSRKLEGIHLRGGRVARGGLRWSDRHDDFRTEILGLMKTQMVKNAVIVPVGSKGGFVLKGQLPPRPALDAYLVDRYREFVAGLLDITDNIVGGKVVHPPEVVFRDEDDPYLVVAADKGTAHLSDTANQVSAQYGFWLGDAFASGGSNGYDHKKEGITARGAWECIVHHFDILGINVDKEPFTVAGIGDMAGDVFGNGMLRSRTTRLVAAFNHQHIFIDPNPDVARSFAERERLFNLPRSTWTDYDTATISAGGGVFERSAKEIPLSAEARTLLDLQAESPSGEEVIRHILTMNVDLLYNGGIGTYIKAAGEDNAEVGDRANDRVRVDATSVRGRVVGEGGNLGLTQAGRIEYWMKGGMINTDAIDNSAGVDMSDHEVNLKVLLDVLLHDGMIKSRDDRNRILREMTDEVSDLVLADNEQQALALTLDGLRSASLYDDYVAFVDDLVVAGILNRDDDGVPTRDALLLSNPARDRGLPRPLLAVMMGHVKNWAQATVLKTSFPDSETARPYLDAYFPKRVREEFTDAFAKHPLRREIIATVAVNHVVNKAGIRFIFQMLSGSKKDLGLVIQAYLDLDTESAASGLRTRAAAAAIEPKKRFDALLKIETALAQATRERLDGKTADVALALKNAAGTPA